MIEGKSPETSEVFLIREGQATLYKNVKIKDKFGFSITRKEKILTLEAGEILNIENLIDSNPN